MGFVHYLRILRRRWLLLLLTTVVGGAVGWTAAAVQTPQYSATATTYVSTTSAANVNDLTVGTTYAQAVVQSYSSIATTSYVLDRVIADLRLDTTPGALADQITVSAGTNSTLLSITASDPSPAKSAAIANATAKELSAAVDRLTPQTDGTRPSVSLSVVNPAVAPTSPSSPKTTLLIGFGLVAGFLLGLLIAVLRELLDTRIRSVEDIHDVTDVPVIGRGYRDPALRTRPVAVRIDGHGSAAEGFRAMSTKLGFLEAETSSNVFLVTSAVPAEGKSTVSVNLAAAVAELGERVLLIDADLRKPSVAEILGLDGGIGLTDHLIGRAALDDVVQTWGPNGLAVLPAGALPPNPHALLQTPAMVALLARVSAEYDVVIIDAPPVLPVADALALSPLAGQTLVVVGAGTVRRAELDDALDALQQGGAVVSGIVANKIQPTQAVAYGYDRRQVDGSAIAKRVRSLPAEESLEDSGAAEAAGPESDAPDAAEEQVEAVAEDETAAEDRTEATLAGSVKGTP